MRRLRGEVSTLEAELEDARDTGASTAAKLTAAEARTAALEAEVAALKADSSSAEQSLRASLATVTATCAELEQERHALAEQVRATAVAWSYVELVPRSAYTHCHPATLAPTMSLCPHSCERRVPRVTTPPRALSSCRRTCQQRRWR